MPRRQNTTSTVHVATVTFMCDIDGEQIWVEKGKTRVRQGHPLLTRYSDSFQPVDTGVHFDVEQATAAPGELRGDPPPADVARPRNGASDL